MTDFADMSDDAKLKYRMLSALIAGPLFAGLAIFVLSLTSQPSGNDAISSASVRRNPVRVALDLSKTRPSRSGNAELVVEETGPLDFFGGDEAALSSPKSQSAVFQQAAFSKHLTAPSHNGSNAKVAIIIDDLGHNVRDNKAALTLPPEVAFAVLPYTRYSKDLAKAAKGSGHELIVHMPMQPKNTAANAGPHVLLTTASELELKKTIAWNLNQFDGYYAVNNHMGSLFTENPRAMRILFEELSQRGLAFFDSRTTPASSSVALAASLGVALAERDVFLDNLQEAVAVGRQLEKLERLAQRHGTSIAIGHPHQVTFDQINAWVKTLEQKGLTLVKPSDILADRKTPYWRRMVRTAQRDQANRATY